MGQCPKILYIRAEVIYTIISTFISRDIMVNHGDPCHECICTTKPTDHCSPQILPFSPPSPPDTCAVIYGPASSLHLTVFLILLNLNLWWLLLNVTQEFLTRWATEWSLETPERRKSKRLKGTIIDSKINFQGVKKETFILILFLGVITAKKETKISHGWNVEWWKNIFFNWPKYNGDCWLPTQYQFSPLGD